MMLSGLLVKESGGWSISCDIIGAYTQGPTRKIALANLAEVVEMMVNRDGFKATVTELGPIESDEQNVVVEANDPALLVATVLGRLRGRNRLSLADVAKKLGTSNVNAYAAYEQGKREPSLSKFREVLAAVAPDMVLTVGPRVTISGTKRKSLAKIALRRRAAAELKSSGRVRPRIQAARG